jgi:hypothetical protein
MDGWIIGGGVVVLEGEWLWVVFFGLVGVVFFDLVRVVSGGPRRQQHLIYAPCRRPSITPPLPSPPNTHTHT